MAQDPLEFARNRFLLATQRALESIDDSDVAGGFRKIAPELAAARMQARRDAIAATTQQARESAARAIGVDLGWRYLDEEAWTGAQIQGQHASRMLGFAQWMEQQQTAGMEPVELRARATTLSQQIAGTEVHDVARKSTAEISGNSPIMGRIQRIAEAGACDVCRQRATRGAVFYTVEASRASDHANCRCKVKEVTSLSAIRRTREEGAIAWQNSELAAKPNPFRGKGVHVDPALTAPGAQTPERMVSIQAQLASFEPLVADGKGTAWMNGQVEQLRAELATFSPRPSTLLRPVDRSRRTTVRGNPSYRPTTKEARTEGLLIEHSAARNITLDGKASRGVVEYQQGGHALLNRVMWGAPESYTGLTQEAAGQVNRMRGALDRLTDREMSPGIEVWRGVPDMYNLDFDRLEAGDVLPVMKGFTSTSVVRSVAETFLGAPEKSVLYQLTVPEGIPGAWLVRHGDPAWAWQSEFVMGRGRRIIVGKVQRMSKGILIVGEVM